MDQLIEFLSQPYQDKSPLDTVLELLTFVFGISSVWLVKKQSVWAYPVGLVATAITAWLLYKVGYYGEMTVNAYFTVMSFFGWYKWGKGRPDGSNLQITRTGTVEKLTGIGMFCLTIVVIFAVYTLFGQVIGTANYIDIFISGLFFTAMWFMALKKIEHWTLWIIGDAIAVPLYWHRGYGILALEYVLFTILAVFAYLEWRKVLTRKATS